MTGAEIDAMLDRAAKRTDWTARALGAATDELHAAGEQGAVVNSTAAEVPAEAERVGELLRQIRDDRELTDSAHRVRDGL
jgi:hypothetical protein